MQELLANIEEPNGSQRGSGGGSSYLYLVVVVLVVCYLVVLGLLLHRLALRGTVSMPVLPSNHLPCSKGPEEYGWLLSLVTFDRYVCHTCTSVVFILSFPIQNPSTRDAT